MSKIKGFYQNNRIYCILMAISLFCLALIVAAFVVYFVEQTKNDTYGNRLDGIKNVQITDTHKEEIASFIKENDKVESVVINIKGKIIYITTTLKDGKTTDAESIAIKSLEKLTEDEKNSISHRAFAMEKFASFLIEEEKKKDAELKSKTKTSKTSSSKTDAKQPSVAKEVIKETELVKNKVKVVKEEVKKSSENPMEEFIEVDAKLNSDENN